MTTHTASPHMHNPAFPEFRGGEADPRATSSSAYHARTAAAADICHRTISGSLATTRGWAIVLAVIGFLLGLVCLLSTIQMLMAAVTYKSGAAMGMSIMYGIVAVMYITLAGTAVNLASKFGPAIHQPTPQNLAVAIRANATCWVTTGVFAIITLVGGVLAYMFSVMAR